MAISAIETAETTTSFWVVSRMRFTSIRRRSVAPAAQSTIVYRPERSSRQGLLECFEDFVWGVVEVGGYVNHPVRAVAARTKDPAERVRRSRRRWSGVPQTPGAELRRVAHRPIRASCAYAHHGIRDVAHPELDAPRRVLVEIAVPFGGWVGGAVRPVVTVQRARHVASDDRAPASVSSQSAWIP